jgi:predicted RNase H-like HicB family nuclease
MIITSARFRADFDRFRAELLIMLVERASGGAAGGFSSYAPDLPGVVAAASTYEECVALMRDAVAFHLEGMREDGDPIPEPA